MTAAPPRDLDDTAMQKLLGVVADSLDLPAAELDADTELLATGRLDSLAMVSLVAYFEEEFGVTLPVDKLVPENFGSVRRMAELVRSELR